jgi:hypothetical protein
VSVVAMVAASCAPPAGGSPDSTTTVQGQPPPGNPQKALCGWASGPAPAQWDHVVLVVFENKSLAQIYDPASPDPYLRSLPGLCGSASDYWAVWIHSLANYLALTSGDTHGQTADPPPLDTPIAGDSIFQQLGTDWRVLAESTKRNCQMTAGGFYEPRHVPSVYYTAIRSICPLRTVPLTDPPDLSSRFTFIVPDKLHDMHMTDLTVEIPARIKAGDDWFRDFLPKLVATPQYKAGRTVILVTWDEGQLTDSHIPLFVISPYVDPGAKETRHFTHYSLTRAMQEMMGLSPLLANAAAAPSMRGGPLEL